MLSLQNFKTRYEELKDNPTLKIGGTNSVADYLYEAERAVPPLRGKAPSKGGISLTISANELIEVPQQPDKPIEITLNTDIETDNYLYALRILAACCWQCPVPSVQSNGVDSLLRAYVQQLRDDKFDGLDGFEESLTMADKALALVKYKQVLASHPDDIQYGFNAISNAVNYDEAIYGTGEDVGDDGTTFPAPDEVESIKQSLQAFADKTPDQRYHLLRAIHTLRVRAAQAYNTQDPKVKQHVLSLLAEFHQVTAYREDDVNQEHGKVPINWDDQVATRYGNIAISSVANQLAMVRSELGRTPSISTGIVPTPSATTTTTASPDRQPATSTRHTIEWRFTTQDPSLIALTGGQAVYQNMNFTQVVQDAIDFSSIGMLNDTRSAAQQMAAAVANGDYQLAILVLRLKAAQAAFAQQGSNERLKSKTKNEVMSLITAIERELPYTPDVSTGKTEIIQHISLVKQHLHIKSPADLVPTYKQTNAFLDSVIQEANSKLTMDMRTANLGVHIRTGKIEILDDVCATIEKKIKNETGYIIPLKAFVHQQLGVPDGSRNIDWRYPEAIPEAQWGTDRILSWHKRYDSLQRECFEMDRQHSIQLASLRTWKDFETAGERQEPALQYLLIKARLTKIKAYLDGDRNSTREQPNTYPEAQLQKDLKFLDFIEELADLPSKGRHARVESGRFFAGLGFAIVGVTAGSLAGAGGYAAYIAITDASQQGAIEAVSGKLLTTIQEMSPDFMITVGVLAGVGAIGLLLATILPDNSVVRGIGDIKDWQQRVGELNSAVRGKAQGPTIVAAH